MQYSAGSLPLHASLSRPVYIQHPPPPEAAQFQGQISYSSHYAQAYGQNLDGTQASSSPHYTPSTSSHAVNILCGQAPTSTRGQYQQHPIWFQPGHSRCTYKDCCFTGSHKTVEVHMMDRHLIYPPGWEKRNKKSDWDADPSLKGKTILIQGTTIVLDSPEVVEAWITERKRRWPTAARVEEKKRKLEEAIARGQLPIADNSLRSSKRRRIDDRSKSHPEYDQTSSRPVASASKRGRGRGRMRGRATDSGWGGMGRGDRTNLSTPPEAAASPCNTPVEAVNYASSSSFSDDEDEEPELVSSKVLQESRMGDSKTTTLHPLTEEAMAKRPEKPRSSALTPKAHQSQPKPLPQNPYVSRPTLLRNLLIPEIRMTISNLSQAIRFLVDNDFLIGVEMKPGDANKTLIQIIEDNRDR